ncbi:hypothetical protein JTB14_025516 [Gonioctena quinquepunctata]|nr:hypothetical protein JTB14_025516 [Gonioctena quinquepunctata]
MTATKTYTSRGSNEESNKMIHFLSHDEDESVEDEGPRLYELLTKLRDATISEGRGHVYLATPEGVDRENVRKITEYAEAKVKTSDTRVDKATTDEEVIEALASATGEKEENVKLFLSLRPGYYDDQIAVVAMPRTPGLTMLKQGRLRVGWISCPVRERTQLQRCYRCLDSGHRSQECRGEDRSKICMKCGKTDHKAKECENGGAGEASSYYATGLKIIQANLNRSKAAHDLAFAIAAEKNVDLLIVSEPNKKLIESQAWLKDGRGDVAALFLNKSVEVTIVRRKRAFLCIHMSHCCMIMIYISPNTGRQLQATT